MAAEKFIRGKVDSCAHDGRRSNVRRLEAAIYHENNWQDEIIEPDSPVVMQPNVEYHIQNRRILHGVFYKGTYYHHGVGQPHSKKNGN